MSIASHFIHRCTRQRPTITTDALGADVREWESDQVSGIACRLVEKSQRVPLSELAERPVITTYTLLVAADADVQQGDRIVSVRDARTDETVEAGPFTIESLVRRNARGPRHKSLQLERA